MAAVLETLDLYGNGERTRRSNVSGSVGSWLAAFFGCPHKEMSRPFSRQGETYRVCINCGARRSFDDTTWNSSGPYYFKPARSADLQDIDTTALRCI
jgi:hypothetical protein